MENGRHGFNLENTFQAQVVSLCLVHLLGDLPATATPVFRLSLAVHIKHNVSAPAKCFLRQSNGQ